MRELSEIKDDLDCISRELLKLLEKKLDCTAELVEYKKAHGLPVFSQEEDPFHDFLPDDIKGHVYEEELRKIFKQVRKAEKSVQGKSLLDCNIALIGFMGTGKSTVSKYLKDMLSMKEADVDAMIVQEQKMAIKDIFAQHGEAYFRDCESNAIISLQNCRRTIITCGGGAVIRDENVKNLKKSSRIVLLTASPETVLERVKYSDERPILNGNMNVEFIKGLIDKRASYYERAADITVETDRKSVQQICIEVAASLVRLEAEAENERERK
ncbi:MAG: shikimate kinase [Lacrimispora sp.]|uniref:shikimate kinase n=1 Tax=Lacrimispora sp. TaxID=2719234 RepID=UPI0039E355C2